MGVVGWLSHSGLSPLSCLWSLCVCRHILWLFPLSWCYWFRLGGRLLCRSSGLHWWLGWDLKLVLGWRLVGVGCRGWSCWRVGRWCVWCSSPRWSLCCGFVQMKTQTHPYNSWGFISIQWFYLALKNKIHISKYNTTHYKHNYIYQPIHTTIIHSFITLFIQHINHSSYYSFIHHTIHSFIISFIHSSYYSFIHHTIHSLIHSLTHSFTHSTYDTYKRHLTQ